MFVVHGHTTLSQGHTIVCSRARARASTIKTTQAQYAYIVRHRPNLFRICLFVYVSMFVDGVVVVVIVVGVTVFLLLYSSSFFVSFSSHFSSYFSTLSFSLSLSPCFFLFSLTSYLSISFSLYLSLLSSLSLTFYLSISSPLPHSLSLSRSLYRYSLIQPFRFIPSELASLNLYLPKRFIANSIKIGPKTHIQ